MYSQLNRSASCDKKLGSKKRDGLQVLTVAKELSRKSHRHWSDDGFLIKSMEILILFKFMRARP